MSCSYALIDGEASIAVGQCIKFEDNAYIKAECSGTQGSVKVYTTVGCAGTGMDSAAVDMEASVVNCGNDPCDYFLQKMEDEDDQGAETACTESNNWLPMAIGACVEIESDETNPPTVMSMSVTECTEPEGVKISVWLGAGQTCSGPADGMMNEAEYGTDECIKCAPPPTTPAPQAAAGAEDGSSSASVRGWLTVGLVAALVAAVATV